MSKPRTMAGRKMVSLPPEMWQAIEDFRFDNRFRSEAEAIRVLVERGIGIDALLEIITLQNRAMAMLGRKRTPDRVIALLELHREIAGKIDAVNAAFGINAPRPDPYIPPGAGEPDPTDEPEVERLPLAGKRPRNIHGMMKPKD